MHALENRRQFGVLYWCGSSDLPTPVAQWETPSADFLTPLLIKVSG
jgi:hypothetical protein